MVCTFGTIPVCLVHLVSLVDLVGLVQPNNSLLFLADFFSFPLRSWFWAVRIGRGLNGEPFARALEPSADEAAFFKV